MERITMKQIEEEFEKWNKNDVQRIRGYFKGAGKTYVYRNQGAFPNDSMIMFCIPDDKIVFYKIATGDHFTLPRKALNFALNFMEGVN
jgi:hypothetical protein